MNKILISGLIASVIVIVIFYNKKPVEVNFAKETVSIFADQSDGKIKLLQGFLNGMNQDPAIELNHELIENLSIKSWRISGWNFYDRAAKTNPKITMLLGDLYWSEHGGWGGNNPWDNWNEFEKFVKKQVAYSKINNKSVNYWDVWGEPDLGGGTPWRGTYEQFVEYVARAHKAIKSEDPNAKIIGPSASKFNARFDEQGKGIKDFLLDLKNKYDVQLDAISWHELESSLIEQIPDHAKSMRGFIKDNFSSDYNPEFHINEYSGSDNHLIPGWEVGWLHYLENSDAVSANKGCWQVKTFNNKPWVVLNSVWFKPIHKFIKWSDCWAGLNGLLTKDGKNPQNVYWVHNIYSKMEGATRIAAKSSDSKISVLASRNDEKGEIIILLGRHAKQKINSDPTPLELEINIESLPASHNLKVNTFEIPNENIPGKMPELKQAAVDFQQKNSNLNFILDKVDDGDAFGVLIKL